MPDSEFKTAKGFILVGELAAEKAHCCAVRVNDGVELKIRKLVGSVRVQIKVGM